jgi:hypothetical protein
MVFTISGVSGSTIPSIPLSCSTMVSPATYDVFQVHDFIGRDGCGEAASRSSQDEIKAAMRSVSG